MKKFTPQVVDEIEAIRWTGRNKGELRDFLDIHAGEELEFDGTQKAILRMTYPDMMIANVGEWFVVTNGLSLEIMEHETFMDEFREIPDDRDGFTYRENEVIEYWLEHIMGVDGSGNPAYFKCPLCNNSGFFMEPTLDKLINCICPNGISIRKQNEPERD